MARGRGGRRRQRHAVPDAIQGRDQWTLGARVWTEDVLSYRNYNCTKLGLSLPHNEGYIRVPAIPSFIALREFLPVCLDRENETAISGAEDGKMVP